MNPFTWIWRAILAKLNCDDDAYHRLVAEVNAEPEQWQAIAETLLTMYTTKLVRFWAPDFDGLMHHVESMIADSLDACARDRGDL
jgi:hypothetical protein